MANVKKIRLPSNTTYNIGDYRIPDLTTSDAGKILKVNSTGSAFEIAEEAVVVYKGTIDLSGVITFTQTYQNLVDDYTAGKYILLWANVTAYGASVASYLSIRNLQISGTSVSVNFVASIDNQSNEIHLGFLTSQGNTSDPIEIDATQAQTVQLVTSVNGQTGAVTLTAANVGAIAIPSSATSGQVLTYNGTTWVASTPTAGGTQKVTKTITGDGSTFRFTINDANVLPLYPGIVQIYDSNWNVVNVDIQFSATGIVILFDEIDAVPAAGTTYTVVIIG